ncbi:hypothetical protein ACNTMW_30910 [Planosporangium sp. 12N6]|uniref:hypothetical protein n=1 Tax=Planosporangium spinosum TaxID=3402278 RepID=UPI003CEAAF14
MDSHEPPAKSGTIALIGRLDELLGQGGEINRAFTKAVMADAHPAGPDAVAGAWHELADLLTLATGYARRLARTPVAGRPEDR